MIITMMIKMDMRIIIWNFVDETGGEPQIPSPYAHIKLRNDDDDADDDVIMMMIKMLLLII